MNGLLSCVVLGFAGLLVAAIVVAWWEHLTRASEQGQLRDSAVPGLVSVDVPLDALGGVDSDLALRREALDGALGRMAQAAAGHDARLAWLETTPMIGPGTLAEPALAASSNQPGARR